MIEFLRENWFPVGLFVIDLILWVYVVYLAYLDDERRSRGEDHVDHP